MRHTSFFTIVVVLVGLVSGCASTNISANSAPLVVDSHADVKTSLTIGKAISGTATITKILFLTFGPQTFADGVAYSSAGGDLVAAQSPLGSLLAAFDPVAKAKSAAAYDAISKGEGSDVILNPRYEIEVKDYFIYKTIKAKVSGTGANISGTRFVE